MANQNESPVKSCRKEILAGRDKRPFEVALFPTMALAGQVGLRVVSRDVDDDGDWKFVTSEIIAKTTVTDDGTIRGKIIMEKVRSEVKNALAKNSERMREYFLLEEGDPADEELKTFFEIVEDLILKSISWNDTVHEFEVK